MNSSAKELLDIVKDYIENLENKNNEDMMGDVHIDIVQRAVDALYHLDISITASEKIKADGEVDELEGLKNFIVNIKPLFLKLKNKEELSDEEKETIVQFYLEVLAHVELFPNMSNMIKNMKDIFMALRNRSDDYNVQSLIEFYVELLHNISASKLKADDSYLGLAMDLEWEEEDMPKHLCECVSCGWQGQKDNFNAECPECGGDLKFEEEEGHLLEEGDTESNILALYEAHLNEFVVANINTEVNEDEFSKSKQFEKFKNNVLSVLTLGLKNGNISSSECDKILEDYNIVATESELNKLVAVTKPPKPATTPNAGYKWVYQENADGTGEWIQKQMSEETEAK